MSKQPESHLSLIIAEGEGQKIEFKQLKSGLDRELVAFANASGGSLYLGITDLGEIKGVPDSNRLVSEIQDIARNCDPPLKIHFIKHPQQVLEVVVFEGADKPYQCKDGFFLRVGPNAQKLKRDEIIALISGEGKVRFDELINQDFRYPQDFSKAGFRRFLGLAGLHTALDSQEILLSLDLATKQKGRFYLNNAGVFFFAKDPQKFFKEAYITCVKYQGTDRFQIIDKQDLLGDPITQIDQALAFCQRHNQVAYAVGKGARHQQISDYPPIALREAIINAVTHRDYFYDGAHIMLHLFSDRIEIENPGGLFKGLTLADLGKRSVRRNRAIADLLLRSKYIERVGSGITRMRQALVENANPPFEVSSSNFFGLRFFPRVSSDKGALALSLRQNKLLQFVMQRGRVSKLDCARYLEVGDDTALRELGYLVKQRLLQRQGNGKGTVYLPQEA